MTQANSPRPENIIGLDVGEKRIGVARASLIAKLPEPIGILVNDETVFAQIKEIAKQQMTNMVVVGIPRNLDGLETPQTASIRSFADKLGGQTGLLIHFADESLSSRRAEAMIKDQKKPTVELDALAACFILEEFMRDK